MGRLFLDATGNYSDPASTNLKYLREGTEWAAPDSEHRFLDAAGGWSAPELVRRGVFGVTFPGFPDDAKGVRTDRASGFDDPDPFVNDGNHPGYSPFDDCYPWSEMQVVERAGGTMVRIPKFWIRYGESGSNGVDTFQISSSPLDGFEVAPAFADRHDGKGERDEIFVGAYHCANGTYKSTSGVMPQTNVTLANMRSDVKRALGDTYHLMDLATQQTIDVLYLVEFADFDSQERIGYGCGDIYGYGAEANGTSDTIAYHTGTRGAMRQMYYSGVKYRGIEDMWANVYTVIDGCYYDRNGLNVILNPSQYSDSSNGEPVGMPVPGFTSKLAAKKVDSMTIFYPTAADAYGPTGTCDYWDFDSSIPNLSVGAFSNETQNYGIFFVEYCSKTSDGLTGYRLLELP